MKGLLEFFGGSDHPDIFHVCTWFIQNYKHKRIRLSHIPFLIMELLVKRWKLLKLFL